MAKEERGTPGRITLKNQPKLTLLNLLRRRKSTLAKFISDIGITTHGALTQWCDRMGIVAPTSEEFVTAFPAAARVNSPREGVIVLEALRVIDEPSGAQIDPDAPIAAPGIMVITKEDASTFVPMKRVRVKAMPDEKKGEPPANE